VVISTVAALATAVANASSNVLNRKAARDEPARVAFRLRLILDLLRKRTWLIAVLIMVLSFVLGAIALGTGVLAAVQTIIILELPMTLIGGVWVLGGHLGKREWAAILAMTAGVVGFLLCLDPAAGGRATVPGLDWLAGSAVSGGLLLAAFLSARATGNPARRAALLGIACGLAYGLAAAYVKGMTQEFSSGGLAAVLTGWQLLAAAVAGLLGMWLLENAYHAGRLAAAQPGITLVDPLVATLWGVLAFREHVRTGPLLAVAVLPLVLLATGVFLLSRSPVLQSAAGASESGEPREPAGNAAGPASGASSS
jgi:drug/metabolite transporter (DMT)-like permease